MVYFHYLDAGHTQRIPRPSSSRLQKRVCNVSRRRLENRYLQLTFFSDFFSSLRYPKKTSRLVRRIRDSFKWFRVSMIWYRYATGSRKHGRDI